MKVDFQKRKVYFGQPTDWGKAFREIERLKALAIAAGLPIAVSAQRITNNENI